MKKSEIEEMENAKKGMTFTLSNDAIEHLKELKESKHINLSAYIEALIVADAKGGNNGKIQ